MMIHGNETPRSRSTKKATGRPARESRAHGISQSPRNKDFSIVALHTFIHAIRDSGYKGTSSAVAELVDNALEAAATSIRISVTHAPTDEPNPIGVVVQDDGIGMDPFTLRHALRFGGSTRFNGRLGPGRYGMGLPTRTLSQTRRVTVYTWRSAREVYMSYLDVDEIAAGKTTAVPAPSRVHSPPPSLS